MFHILLLKQDVTKKWRISKKLLELDVSNSKEYKVEAIWDSVIYARESKVIY